MRTAAAACWKIAPSRKSIRRRRRNKALQWLTPLAWALMPPTGDHVWRLKKFRWWDAATNGWNLFPLAQFFVTGRAWTLERLLMHELIYLVGLLLVSMTILVSLF
jgi:hypothetical protein